MGQKDSKPRSYSLNSNEINDVARDTNAKPQDIKNILKAFAKMSTPDGKVSKADFKKVYVIVFQEENERRVNQNPFLSGPASKMLTVEAIVPSHA
jgi:Ca2+-binding EF-hand superfamily protein